MRSCLRIPGKGIGDSTEVRLFPANEGGTTGGKRGAIIMGNKQFGFSGKGSDLTSESIR